MKSSVLMKQDDDPYAIESPWGAMAGFFLIQCFGYVTLHGFRMFLSIAVNGADALSVFEADGFFGRILLTCWGLMWMFLFVAFEVDIFRRLSAFWRKQDARRFLNALRSPAETFKALLCVIFAMVFAAFSLGHYPFPTRPIPTVVTVLFWLFGWGVSGIIAWGLRTQPVREPEAQEGSTGGAIVGFIVGTAFVTLACFVQIGLFYFHGMIGLGVMTMIACHFLFKTQVKETPNPTSSPQGQCGHRP